jgi:ABC-2 type transport system permease protein
MIFSLTESAEDQSSLPVGIVDDDQSRSSEELIIKLKELSSLKVMQKSEKELNKLLMDEMILSYFVIGKGYEQKIRSQELEGIISVYYKSSNKAASILSDIIAGEMLYPICYYKALNLYEKLPFDGQKHSKDMYEAYMESLLKDSKDFDFAFEMNYLNPQQNSVLEGTVPNSILYSQLIFGILGILMAFIAMFVLSGVVGEKEIGVAERIKLTRFHFLAQDIGNFCALILIEGGISLVFSGLLFASRGGGDDFLWISSFLLLLLNAFVLGGMFLLISKLIKSMIIYQLLCSTIILLSGGIGFYQLLTGFYHSAVDDIRLFIPNNWFIQGFTDIIVYGNSGGYLKEGHWALLFMAAAIFAFLILYHLLQWLIGHRLRIKDRNRTVN